MDYNSPIEIEQLIENADLPNWMKVIKKALEERLRRKNHDKISK